MNDIITLPVSTISHIPRKVRAQVLTAELHHACQNGIWGFVCLSLFPKAVLRTPPRGGKKNNMWLGYSFHHVYIGGGKGTWLHCGQKHMQMPNPSTTTLANSRRALRIAQEGHFSDAMRALGASGCASPENVGALNDLLSRHLQNPLPDIVDRD